MAVNTNYKSYLSRDSEVYRNRFIPDSLQNNVTLNGKRVFNVTHETVAAQWNPSLDYQLGVIQNGLCNYCCTSEGKMHTPSEVVVQVGAHRFGVDVGLCLPCINSILRAETPQLHNLHLEYSFAASQDLHQVDFTVDRLRDLMNRETALNNSLIEAGLPLSEFNRNVINYILEGCVEVTHLIDDEKKSTLFCSQCKKMNPKFYSDEESFEGLFHILNMYRAEGHLTGCCKTCSLSIELTSGCSMFTCNVCLSHPKTCIICMEGATGRDHSKSCNEDAEKLFSGTYYVELLPIQKCACTLMKKEKE